MVGAIFDKAQSESLEISSSTKIQGTGLVVWEVFGEPSGLRIVSQFP